MGLEVAYNLRHLLARPLTTILTIGGIALVVFVFTATLMLSAGIRKTLGSTGSDQNVIVIRTGAQNEIQSGITREHANIILSQPEIARDDANNALASSDVVVLISLRKRSDGLSSNVNVRGVSQRASNIRPGIAVIKGRLPESGTQEIIVGKAIYDKFEGTDLGQSLRMVNTDWKVVGIFDGGNSSFSSEIWGDADIMLPAFRRDSFSSITFRLQDQTKFDELKNRLENEPRLNVDVKHEKQFYEDQSASLSAFIKYLGSFVSIVFSIGAIIGAMITMYSAVANRVREIGVLRALGFKKRNIFAAFLKESIVLSLLGGIVGVALACLMSFVTVTTTNFQTFSEVAFKFSVNPSVVLSGMLFALVMGVLGGILPAARARQLKVIDCLRQRV